jgi:hypothetical protein
MPRCPSRPSFLVSNFTSSKYYLFQLTKFLSILSDAWAPSGSTRSQSHIFWDIFCYHKLNVTTMWIPTKRVLWCDGKQWSEKSNIYIIIRHFCHCHSHVVTIPTQVIFHSWKRKFDWVEIGWIWGQKFTAHSPITTYEKKCIGCRLCTSPFSDVVLYFRVFMDFTVIHDNHRVRGRVWLHVVK